MKKIKDVELNVNVEKKEATAVYTNENGEIIEHEMTADDIRNMRRAMMIRRRVRGF